MQYSKKFPVHESSTKGAKSQVITLNNGKLMPILGLGTYSPLESDITQEVKDAIDAGYRHIDCAFVYENEEQIGKAIASKIDEKVVKREDLFVTSKLWNTFHDPKDVREACENSLKKLNLDYLDLYLIHWPIGYPKSKEHYPKNEAGKPLYAYFDLLDTYRAMEELVYAGLTKSIGVSNFNIKQINHITENAHIQPVINQIECHPYLLNTKLREHCNSKYIVITAYSPLGSPGHMELNSTIEHRSLFDEPKLKAIAEKYKKSPVQILLRFQIELGNVVIPKPDTKEHIIGNIDIFDFELTEEDMNDLQSFGHVQRSWDFEIDKAHPEYPFHED